jgi:hypothetical protein
MLLLYVLSWQKKLSDQVNISKSSINNPLLFLFCFDEHNRNSKPQTKFIVHYTLSTLEADKKLWSTLYCYILETCYP